MKYEKKVLSVLHSSHPTKFFSFSNFPTTCNTWTKMEKGNKCTENHLYILLQECLLTSPAKCCCEISSSDWWTGTLKTEKKIEREREKKIDREKKIGRERKKKWVRKRLKIRNVECERERERERERGRERVCVCEENNSVCRRHTVYYL